jgi:ferredoxin-NADP reductase
MQQAVPGDSVKVKVGGSFTFAESDIQEPLLFFAGGIGITPIISMLKHAIDLSVDACNVPGASCAFLSSFSQE